MKKEKRFEMCPGCGMMKNLTFFDLQMVWLCGFCKKEATEDAKDIIIGS